MNFNYFLLYSGKNNTSTPRHHKESLKITDHVSDNKTTIFQKGKTLIQNYLSKLNSKAHLSKVHDSNHGLSAHTIECDPESSPVILLKGFLDQQSLKIKILDKSLWMKRWVTITQELPSGLSLPLKILNHNPTYLSKVLPLLQKNEAGFKARLNIYKERLDWDLKMPPKQSLVIDLNIIIHELACKCPSSRFTFEILSPDKKIVLASHTENDRDEWVYLMNKIKNYRWYKEYEPLPLAGKNSSQDSSTLLPPQMSISSHINDKKNFTVEAFPVLEEKDIENIIHQKNHLNLFIPSSERVLKLKNEKWNEIYQSLIDAYCNGISYSKDYLQLMEKIGEFKNMSIYYAKKLVDEVHMKSNIDKKMDRLVIGELSIRYVAEYKLGVDILKGEKRAEHEIKAARAILSTKSSSLLRGRLIWMIDYKGFRLEASILLPVREEHLIFDLNKIPPFSDHKILDLLKNLGAALNLKPYEYTLEDAKTCVIGTSKHVKVYKDPKGQFYLSNMDSILPIDNEANNNEDLDPKKAQGKRLRMELLNMYPQSVSSDLSTSKGLLQNLKERQIELLAEKLDRLDIIPWSSDLLSEYFHIHGINIRCLGSVHAKVKLPHVKELCQMNMVARAFKHILGTKLRQVVFHYQEMGAINIQNELFTLTCELYSFVLGNASANENQKFIHGPLKNLICEKFGTVDILWNHFHKQALFDIMNQQCAIIWEHKPYDFTQEKPFVISNVIAFGIREKGIFKEPEIYPYFRLNEYNSTSCLGLFLASSISESIGDFGSDLLVTHSTSHYYHSFNNTSPTMNYFTSYLTSKENICHEKDRESSMTLSNYIPPPIPFMVGIHFTSLGVFKCQPNIKSAIWFYLLAHHSLFIHHAPKDALWQVKVALAFNSSLTLDPAIGNNQCILDYPFHQYQHSTILSAQSKLLLLQIYLVLNDYEDTDVQEIIDSAHKELIEALGHHHPLLMRFYQVLAGSYWYMKDFEKCVQYQKIVVEYSLRGLGKTHPWTLKSLLMLGSFCLYLGDIEHALHAFREALQVTTFMSNTSLSLSCPPGSQRQNDNGYQKMNEPQYSIDPLFIADIHYALAEAYSVYGDLEASLCHSKSSQKIKENVLGNDSPVTMNSYYQCAEIALACITENNAENEGGDKMIEIALSKIVTKNISTNLKLALNCYDKIFQFIKYYSCKSTTNNKSKTISSSEKATKSTLDIQKAIYTSVQKRSFDRHRGIPFQEILQDQHINTLDSSVSTQLFELIRKIIWLNILLLEPLQRDILRRLYKKMAFQTQHDHDHHHHHHSAFESDSMHYPAVLSSQHHHGLISLSSLKPVIVKLIAYHPGNYFMGLVDKLLKGLIQSTDANDGSTEHELLCVFYLLDMSPHQLSSF